MKLLTIMKMMDQTKRRKRGLMKTNQLQNRKEQIHLMKRTHQKIKKRKQNQKIKVTNHVKAKILRNQKQQHQKIREVLLNQHLQKNNKSR